MFPSVGEDLAMCPFAVKIPSSNCSKPSMLHKYISIRIVQGVQIKNLNK
jgi:hypothetical protein